MNENKDRPTIVTSDRTKKWLFEGRLHRECGPAIEYANGIKRWYFQGIEYKESDFDILMIKIQLHRRLNEKFEEKPKGKINKI